MVTATLQTKGPATRRLPHINCSSSLHFVSAVTRWSFPLQVKCVFYGHRLSYSAGALSNRLLVYLLIRGAATASFYPKLHHYIAFFVQPSRPPGLRFIGTPDGSRFFKSVSFCSITINVGLPGSCFGESLGSTGEGSKKGTSSWKTPGTALVLHSSSSSLTP